MIDWAKHKRKHVSVFFMLVIFMPMIFSLSLLAWRQLIQWQMVEELEASNLTTIVIKKSSIHWTREGKEMEIDGHLFDVEDISTNGDSCIMKGLFDEKEEALVKTIKKTQQQSPYNKPLHLLYKSLSHLLFTEHKTDCPQLSASRAPKKYRRFNTACFISRSVSPAGPPPRYS